MRRIVLSLLAAAMVAGPAFAADGQGPRLKVSKLEQLPTPLPKPYADQTPAQVNAAIDAAFAKAKATNKNVIVDLGGNWCSWCRVLAGTMALPEAKPFVDQNFEVVTVSVSSAKGQIDQNAQVLRRFKVKKVDGVPWLIVADPTGKVLASSSEVTDDKHETPQAMIDWIAAYAPQNTTPKKAKS
jgi:thiol:disulfide interchange protein